MSVDPVAACHVRALMLQNEDALLHTAVRWTCWGAPACGCTGAASSLMGRPHNPHPSPHSPHTLHTPHSWSSRLPALPDLHARWCLYSAGGGAIVSTRSGSGGVCSHPACSLSRPRQFNGMTSTWVRRGTMLMSMLP